MKRTPDRDRSFAWEWASSEGREVDDPSRCHDEMRLFERGQVVERVRLQYEDVCREAGLQAAADIVGKYVI